MSALIEKVAKMLRELADTDPTSHTDARAAIAAVAECLRAKRHGCHDYSADFLQKKLEQPK